MDRLKRKFGFVILAGILMFATTFGLGVSSLANFFASENYIVAETENENVSDNSLEDEIGAMAVADVTYNQQYVTTAPTNLAGQTVSIANSLFVYNNTTMLGSLANSDVEITNSIFVYTGSGSASLFSGTPTDLYLNNVIFYASSSGSLNVSNITTDMKSGGFVYGSSEPVTHVWEDDANDWTKIDVSLTTLLGEVRFLAQNTYTHKEADKETDYNIWSGSWNFSNEGWAYAASELVGGSWTSRPTGVYPYPASYINEKISGTEAVKVYLYSGISDEADNSKIVMTLPGSRTIGLESQYILARPGYEQIGWYVYPELIDDPSATEPTDGTFAAKVTIPEGSEGISIFAAWKTIEYTITFNSTDDGRGEIHGGSEENDSHKITYTIDTTDSISLLTETSSRTYITRGGYRLEGWRVASVSVSDNGQGSSGGWEQGEIYTDATIPEIAYGNVILTPNWVPYTYTLRYNGNGGQTSSSASSYTQTGFTYRDDGEATQTMTGNQFTRPGYTFAGWAKSEGGEAVYANGAHPNRSPYTDFVPTSNNQTFDVYAVWTGNPYNITYNTDKGDLPDDAATQYRTGSSTEQVVFPDNDDFGDSAFGWTFDHWTISQVAIDEDLDGEIDSNEIYTSGTHGGWTVGNTYTGTSTSNYGHIELQAHWTPRNVTIIYNLNGENADFTDVAGGTESGTTVRITRKYNAQLSTMPTATRTGYTFEGWSTSDTASNLVGKETIVSSLNVVDSNGELIVNLYGDWTPIPYEVKVDGNGGETSTGQPSFTQAATYDEPLAINNVTWVREGHSFGGYKLTASGNASTVTEVDSVDDITSSGIYLVDGVYYVYNLRTTKGTTPIYVH